MLRAVQETYRRYAALNPKAGKELDVYKRQLLDGLMGYLKAADEEKQLTDEYFAFLQSYRKALETCDDPAAEYQKREDQMRQEAKEKEQAARYRTACLEQPLLNFILSITQPEARLQDRRQRKRRSRCICQRRSRTYRLPRR